MIAVADLTDSDVSVGVIRTVATALSDLPPHDDLFELALRGREHALRVHAAEVAVAIVVRAHSLIDHESQYEASLRELHWMTNEQLQRDRSEVRRYLSEFAQYPDHPETAAHVMMRAAEASERAGDLAAAASQYLESANLSLIAAHTNPSEAVRRDEARKVAPRQQNALRLSRLDGVISVLTQETGINQWPAHHVGPRPLPPFGFDGPRAAPPIGGIGL